MTVTASDEIRRRELASFLRSRRERITPEQVGLVPGKRRRTPGLRREEVAHLSTVGVTWYTWLEQGRNIQVSAQVLDALARALQMDSAERAHLFTLAGTADPTPGKECGSISPALRQMLRQLEPFPALIQNSRYDILAYNRTYGRLLCDLDALTPEDRNCMLLAFTHPEWRAAMVDREEAVRLMTANFRAHMAEHIAEPAWKHLLKRLKEQSEEFCALWDEHEVELYQPGPNTKSFLNREVGLLRVHAVKLWLGPQIGGRLISYTPADEESRQRLERLYETAPADGDAEHGRSADAGQWETAPAR